MNGLVAAIALCAAAPGAARAHFDEARRLYEAKAYGRAADELRAAYDLDPSADLAFDLGQTLRLAGQSPVAVHYYRLYLAARPDAADAPIVRATIAVLEGSAPPLSARQVGTPAAASATKPHWPVYASAAVTAAAFVAAGVFGVLAQNASGDLLGSVHPASVATSLETTTQREATIANVLYAVGGVGAAGTGALVLWEFR